MATLSLSPEALYIPTTIFAVLAILFTIVRLLDRATCHNFWWDDFWAGVAALTEILFFSDVWTRLGPRGDTSFPILTRIALFWISAITFPVSVWAAKLSIALSIARILPSSAATQRNMLMVAIFFFLCCVGLLLHKIIICGRDPSWHATPKVHCRLGTTLGYVTISTDLASDALLVAIPVRFLWNVQLPKNERRLILWIFMANIIMTLSGIVYCVFNMHASSFGEDRARLMTLVTQLKSAITLIACNLLVIATLVYRWLRRASRPKPVANFASSSTTTTSMSQPPNPSSMTSTTSHIHSHDFQSDQTKDIPPLSNTQLSFTQITTGISNPRQDTPPASPTASPEQEQDFKSV